jgi:group I intron endonuclease
MNTGIYAIRNITNGKVYVGSAGDIKTRWNVHRCLLRKGTHHSPHLQAAWNKHGAEAFHFEKLLVCKKEHLLLYEQILIDGMHAANRQHGYNAAPMATGTRGKVMSEEARAKIRAARAKQVFSPETRALWSKNRTGRKMPASYSKYLSERQQGFKHSEASKARISAVQIGRKQSLQTVERRGKLTLEQVKEVFALREQGLSQAAIAKKFSIDPSTVSIILSGKRWGNFTTSPERKSL